MIFEANIVLRRDTMEELVEDVRAISEFLEERRDDKPTPLKWRHPIPRLVTNKETSEQIRGLFRKYKPLVRR